MIKVNFKSADLLALIELLDMTVAELHESQKMGNLSKDDLLILCIFHEISLSLKMKALKGHATYTITFKPYWGVAIDLYFRDLYPVTSFHGNLIHSICNNVDKATA